MDKNKVIPNIEVIMNDMTYMKNDLAEIKATLKIVLEKYVHREEMVSRFDRIQAELDKRFDGAHTRIDTKCDKEDLERLVSTMTWLNRIVIGSVVAGILALVINYTQ
jgi:hypothetical protein